MIREPVAVALHLDERKLGAQEFKRLSDRAGLIRERRIKRQQARENFGKPGRDVRGFGGVMSGFLQRAGWLPHMQIAALTEDWASIVGDVLAAHTRVERLADGVLTISTESPAWTQQVQFLRPQILEKVRKTLTGLTVDDVRVVGPQAHGPGMRKRLYVQHNMRPPRER